MPREIAATEKLRLRDIVISSFPIKGPIETAPLAIGFRNSPEIADTFN